MNELTSKYHQLGKAEQQEVQDFIDFLLNKKSHEHRTSYPEYSEQLLKVSKWNEEDFKSVG